MADCRVGTAQDSPSIPETELQSDTPACISTPPCGLEHALHRWRYPLLLLALAFYLGLLVCSAWLCDDAFISFRTVDNFVNGYGLRWNVHERVQSYTHPLWLFLFSGVYVFTREPYYSGIFFSMAMSMAAMAWFAWKVAKSTAGAVLGIVILACSTAFLDYSTSGLENPLTHLLLGIFFWRFWTCATAEKETIASHSSQPLKEVATGPVSAIAKTTVSHGLGLLVKSLPFQLSFLAALMAWNRMDSVLLVAPVLVYVLIQNRTWRCVRAMAVGMLPLILWMAFSLFYYGFPFPNTAYAKLNNHIAVGALAYQGCYYLWDSLTHDPITLTTIVASLCLACYRKQAKDVCVALGVLCYLLYIVKIGGDFMTGRFLTAPLFLAVCLLSTIRWPSAKAWALTAMGIVSLAFASTHPPTFSSKNLGLGDMCHEFEKIVARHGICDERDFYYSYTGLLKAFEDKSKAMPSSKLRFQGEMLRKMATASISKIVVDADNIGFLGFYSGPEIALIDPLGLTDALLARLPPVANPFWRIGHFRRDFPEGYFASVQTEKNRLQDPGLMEYYDHFSLITQGNLWSWERLVAIGNMNLGRYDSLLKQTRINIAQTPPLEYLWMPNSPEAIEKLDQIIALNPQDPTGYMFRSTFYRNMGQQEKAIQDYNRILELTPDNLLIHMYRGYIYLRQRQFEEAAKDFQCVIALNPNQANIYVCIGDLQRELGHLEQSIEALSHAIDLDPCNIYAYVGRGKTYEHLKDLSQAIANFRKVIFLDPLQPKGYHLMASTLVTVDHANEIYRVTKTAPPELPVAVNGLAWILATHPNATCRNGVEALLYAQETQLLTHQIVPQFTNTLSAAYAEAGKFPEAIEAAKRAIQEAAISASPGLSQLIQKQLDLYKKNEPFHFPASDSK